MKETYLPVCANSIDELRSLGPLCQDDQVFPIWVDYSPQGNRQIPLMKNGQEIG
jgi:hypothetical protein